MVLNGHWKRTCNFEDEHCQQMKKLFYENMDETPTTSQANGNKCNG